MGKYFILLNLVGFLVFGFTKNEMKGTLNDSYQSVEDSTIIWNKNRPLKWSDFLAKPDTLSSYKAITSTNLKTKIISFTTEKIEYEIYNEFEKYKSWTNLKSDNLLKHEQVHFDIAEIAIRKLRRKFSQYKLVDIKSLNDKINELFNEAILERRSLNKKYDEETNHGINLNKQRKWELSVKNDLESLKAYSSIKVIITK